MLTKKILKTIIKWTALIIGSLLLIIISWYTFSRLLSSQSALRLYEIPNNTQATPSDAASGRLTIGSFNIAHGRGGKTGATNWQYHTQQALVAHLAAIAQQLREANVDILILNEVDFAAAWSFHLNQAEFLATQAKYPYVAEQRNFDVSFPFYTFQFGNAILSRYPLREVQFMDFPPYSDYEDRFAGNHDALFGIIDTSMGPLGILAVHLEYRSEAVRVQCVQQIMEWSQSQPFPIIVAGDFNSTPIGFPRARQTHSGQNAMTLLFEEGGFTSAIQTTPEAQDFTFPSEQPKIMIDWVVGKGEINIVNSQVIHSNLSDHFMVTAVVQIMNKQ